MAGLWDLIWDRRNEDLQYWRQLVQNIESYISGGETVPSSVMSIWNNGTNDTLYDSRWNLLVDDSDSELYGKNKIKNGVYTATDLNRVANACLEVAQMLQDAVTDMMQYAEDNDVGWDVIYDYPYDPDNYEITVKANWFNETNTTNVSSSNFPNKSRMTTYLNNVKLLRNAINADYPKLPSSMDGLDYIYANNIERVVMMVFEALQKENERIKALIDNAALSPFYSGEVYCGEVEA